MSADADRPRDDVRPAGQGSFRGELAFRADVFAWCLRRARACSAEGSTEAALAWLEVAGRQATSYPFGHLASGELEGELLRVARQVALPPSARAGGAQAPAAGSGAGPHRARWLHVFTEVYEIGGHTAMAARWMDFHDAVDHGAVLLNQRSPVPEYFAAAVARRGGRLRRLDPAQPVLERAAALRALAWAEADVVVLHVHGFDVVPMVAFGVAGGPPVLLLNHADHLFGLGGAVADLVVDLRPAGQELTLRHRGIPRTVLLPILIPEASASAAGGASMAPSREEAKAKLGLPQDSVMLLTVARAEKYLPLRGRGLDFLDAAEAILRAHPRAWLLAVGPKHDVRWEAASRNVGGRVRADGPLRDLRLYHAAADVYLESFPMGSATAALEAAIHGIPCVRGPASTPPPANTGGLGIQVLEQPADEDAYVEHARRLLQSEPARRVAGAKAAAAVRAHHTGSGWLGYLHGVMNRLPREHAVHPVPVPKPSPEPVAAFWAELSLEKWPCNALVGAFEDALAHGLRPRIDRPLRVSLGRPDRWRRHDDHRLAFVRWLSPLLRLPGPTYGRAYDNFSYFLRPGGRILRTWQSFARRVPPPARPAGS